MATIKANSTNSNRKYRKVTWPSLADSDDGSIVDFGKYPEKTLQITGTLDTAVPGLEGSMDKQTWFLLTTDGTNAIAALGLFYVWENPNFIRPNNDGGDSNTDITYQLGMSTLV